MLADKPIEAVAGEVRELIARELEGVPARVAA